MSCSSPDPEATVARCTLTLTCTDTPAVQRKTDAALCRRYADHVGIHYVLCSKLRQFAYEELEFFLPQYVAMPPEWT